MPRPILLAALLLAAPAAAQTPAAAPASIPVPGSVAEGLTLPPPPPDLPTLTKSPQSQVALVAAARAQFSQIPGSCAAAAYKPTGDLTVFQAPSFGPDGTPIAGMWAERVAVTGCGPARMLNVLTVAKPGGDPDRIAMMPGTSHADPLTQRTALRYAQAIAARASPPGCQRQSFIEADFDGYVGLPNAEVRDGRDGRAWQEDWLLYACGAVYGIKMQFTPNGAGTELVGSNPIRLNAPAPAAGPAPPAQHH